MTLSTPYLLYILGAYGLTLFGLGIFLIWSLLQWRKSSSQLNKFSDET